MVAVFCAQKLPLVRQTVSFAFEWDHRCYGYQRRCTWKMKVLSSLGLTIRGFLLIRVNSLSVK
jgi:hypothetical protein